MGKGMLAGLVAITAPCAFGSAGGAAIIGIISGLLVVESVFFFERTGIDDCVGAISVTRWLVFWSDRLGGRGFI